jgi:hypothetical protein
MKFSIALITLSILSVHSAAFKERCAPKESNNLTDVEVVEATSDNYTPQITAVSVQEEAAKEPETYTTPKKEEVKAAAKPEIKEAAKEPQGYATPRPSGGTRAPTSKVIASNLKGATTHFDDDEYQCEEWNFRAKSAMLQGFKFAATNFQLCSPEKTGDFKLECGGSQYKCARTTGPDPQEYIIIDWCDPNGAEQCTEAEPGHLDILVAGERDNDECIKGCDAYNSFIKVKTAWELVECSFEISASKFGASKSYLGDGSEYGK